MGVQLGEDSSAAADGGFLMCYHFHVHMEGFNGAEREMESVNKEHGTAS